MTAIAYALRLLGFTLGACLNIFLLVIVLRKKAAGLTGLLAAAALAAASLWQAGNAGALFRRLATDVAEVPGIVSLAGPAALLLAVAAGLNLLAARRRARTHERRFLWVLAAMLAAISVAWRLASPSSLAPALLPLALSFIFAWFIYRYNILDLQISRRVVSALNLSVFLAFYLVLVKVVTPFFEESVPLIGLALIFPAAGLAWLLLYGWMTRSLAKRTHLYASFSKRMIEDAARILDLGERLQFLAGELGRTFGLRRVLLLASGKPPARGEFGGGPDGEPSAALRDLEELATEQHYEVVCTARPGPARLTQPVRDLGYNYLFPLWYQNHLAGLLLLDTTPRMFLDENEDVLLGLGRQISHSIENCRVIEEKISLERALARQEHLASLGRAATTIAHEVKNPLSAIKALAQVMREDQEVLEKYDRDLVFMIEEADRLDRSIMQLLSFSRPLPAQQGGVDLSGLVEDVARALARQYAGEGVRVEHQVEPNLRLETGDPETARQVLLNLTLNAIQASEPGATVLLAVGRLPDGAVQVTVTDEGPGISAAIRDRIFEPFFTTKQRGTGLGLAIVQKNVHYLGGVVNVESPVAEGRGTRIQVRLPAV